MIRWMVETPAVSGMIRHAGGIRLVAIDPPFFSGTAFRLESTYYKSCDRARRFHKRDLAYDDTWKNGFPEYLGMIYEGLKWIYRILADEGSLYVHCDWRANAAIRLILDEIFGRDCFQREIIWRIGWVSGFKTRTRNWIRNHDTILFYTKNPDNFIFNKQLKSAPPGYQRRQSSHLISGKTRPVEDIWNIDADDRLDSIMIKSFSREKVGYPTQKSEALLDRIIRASSNEGDIVADFFSGSGTALIVADRLKRKWIGCDSSRSAIDITRRRLLLEPAARPSGGHRADMAILHGSPVWMQSTTTSLKIAPARFKPLHPDRHRERQAPPPFDGWEGRVVFYLKKETGLISVRKLRLLHKTACDNGAAAMHILAGGYSIPMMEEACRLNHEGSTRIVLKIIPPDPRRSWKSVRDFPATDAVLIEIKANWEGRRLQVELVNYQVFEENPPDIPFVSLIDCWAVGPMRPKRSNHRVRSGSKPSLFRPLWYCPRPFHGSSHVSQSTAPIEVPEECLEGMMVMVSDSSGRVSFRRVPW